MKDGHPDHTALTARNRPDHFTHRDGQVFAGLHLIVEVAGGAGLDDASRLERAFRDCATACGARILHLHTHRFSPQGLSGVAVLAESHITAHTWPEIGYGAFDIFMCGDADPWRAIPVLERVFETSDVRTRELRRGENLISEAE